VCTRQLVSGGSRGGAHAATRPAGGEAKRANSKASGLRLLGDPASAPTTRRRERGVFVADSYRSAALMGKRHCRLIASQRRSRRPHLAQEGDPESADHSALQPLACRGCGDSSTCVGGSCAGPKSLKRVCRNCDAVVRPIASTTCDLDRAIIAGATPFVGSFAISHECVAEVVDIGDGAATLRPGHLSPSGFVRRARGCHSGAGSKAEAVARGPALRPSAFRLGVLRSARAPRCLADRRSACGVASRRR
jgi:hypothetical protein